MRKRHYVAVQRLSSSKDEVGQIVEAWADVSYQWVNIMPLSSREYFNASGERATLTHKIFMWYGPDISTADRLKYGERVFDIDGIVNIREENKELELVCREVVG